MATIIVLGSVALGLVFTLLWCARPALRRQIEAPNIRFAADAKRYDIAQDKAGSPGGGESETNDD